MKLVAEILTGGLFYVEIEEDATVHDLKDKIGNQENLPANRLILLLDADDGKRYLLDNDGVFIRDYGVQDGSHIYIFFQIPLNERPSATPPISSSSSSISSQDSSPKESPVTPPPPVSTSSDSEEE